MNEKEKETQVKLLKPHTHAGIDHLAGATIRVPVRLVPWLERQGVIAQTAANAGTKE